MITAGLNGATLLSASESAAAAESFNENVDLARDSILGILPTDKIPLGSVQDQIIAELTEEDLHRPTDKMEHALHAMNHTFDTLPGIKQLNLPPSTPPPPVPRASETDSAQNGQR